MDKLEDAIAILKKALEVGRKAIRIHEVLALGTTSKRLLYRAYEDHAVCHVNQAKFYGRMKGEIFIPFAGVLTWRCIHPRVHELDNQP